jgi:hypothetical protein
LKILYINYYTVYGGESWINKAGDKQNTVSRDEILKGYARLDHIKKEDYDINETAVSKKLKRLSTEISG